MALFKAITSFSSKSLKPTETDVKHIGDMFPEKKWKGKARKVIVMAASHINMHGSLGNVSWEPPRTRIICDVDARPGYNSMKAHEYEESPGVLQEKVKLLASLLRRSKATCAYTGAGISTASGIDDYATKDFGEHSGRRKIKSPFDALPTKAHRVMAQMHSQKHLHYWIQQNHDGLPQKAGYPQHDLNEIHGAWYDPSNPVVKMNGTLRSDLFGDLLEWEQKSELVLALGTSMCGMNADRVARTCYEKANKKKPEALGAVIVNLQQTKMDSCAALRIFAPLDEVFTLLAAELGYSPQDDPICGQEYFTLNPASGVERGVFDVPYDKDGNLVEGATTKLDLREGATLRITEGPYKGAEGEVLEPNREGPYKIRCMVTVGKFKTPWPLLLGSWWVQAAINGRMKTLPLVTLKAAPEAEEKQAPAAEIQMREYNGRCVGISGLSMADGGAPPKNLLAEIKAAVPPSTPLISSCS
jgi:NAD-dependent SIR2 family protein deacetylase